MAPPLPNDPLHGLTLETIVTELVAHFGWEELGQRVRVRCFSVDPSVRSSLKFLRKTPWAREQVERLYLSVQRSMLAGERVRRRAARSFPPGALAAVMAELGDPAGAIPELERVQLAALKLSEGDVGRLREAMVAARRDYRDVLGAAEYPREMRLGANAAVGELAQARADDRREYEAWLGR